MYSYCTHILTLGRVYTGKTDSEVGLQAVRMHILLALQFYVSFADQHKLFIEKRIKQNTWLHKAACSVSPQDAQTAVMMAYNF